MLKAFKTHINNNLPFLNKSKLLITVSGGIDSVVLTYLCHSLQLDVSLAHCNFHLREEESDADETFVMQLADNLQLEAFVEHFNTNVYAKTQKLSTQMAARELRYAWFQELAAQLGFDYILTAHHADDNLETFLINLTRGTGLEGLTGIPEINKNIVRPLLPFSRTEIEAYAQENKITWRDDSSNASTKYLRNKLRHDVIPTLKTINPQLLENFSKTQQYLSASKTIIYDALKQVCKRVVTEKEGMLMFDISALKKLSNPKAYLYELLKDYGFTAWDDITNLLDAQSGKSVSSQTHVLLKDRDFLMLSENVNSESTPILINHLEPVKITSGVLSFQKVNGFVDNDLNNIYVDKDLLKFPLTVRTWKKGDYFCPFGMKGSKKISKYFKDEKLSLFAKEQVRLLCSEEQIVWVIGYRMDSRFKITNSTTNILKITLTK